MEEICVGVEVGVLGGERENLGRGVVNLRGRMQGRVGEGEIEMCTRNNNIILYEINCSSGVKEENWPQRRISSTQLGSSLKRVMK